MDYNKIIKESQQVFEKVSVIIDAEILGKKVMDLSGTDNEVYDSYGVDSRIIVAADKFTEEDNTDRFACENNAEKYLESKGYAVGRMQSGSPRGLMKGNYEIMKWRNLDSKDKDKLDGILVSYRTYCIAFYFTMPTE